MTPVAPTFAALRRVVDGTDDPVVIFNKSHSGSRLLAELVDAAGVFLGAERNESRDSLPIWEWVEGLVREHYPDFSALWDPDRPADPALEALGERAFARHLRGFPREPGRRWGWKLCETAYALPVVDHCFPRARYVHLIRDGRDVAFSDHRGPTDAVWRKIYFDTDRIRSFGGRPLSGPAYRREAHLHNAIHWVNSVRVGRTAGMMLRERYLEVCYEDLCLDFERTARRVLEFVGAPAIERGIATLAPKVRGTAIGKHRGEPLGRLRAVLAIEKPLLLSLGYLEDDPEPPRAIHRGRARVQALLERARRRRRQTGSLERRS